ncbi:mandelate racemase/muconate lactonizing enzyme family protein [Roseomonas sp. PWR1]|uniref:Mandelate racemase/muconate lactonizing enzyme family protein n=1 Tax=Roseomonas nitratireducens TaxID=2820810 RepID=A0ABS4AW07_9PROT|nr:mandelate racemase/muconate lactonizing enzyme family protein [Neoroseomonas nitratireducens]MBP0465502.1 mandelate racemase/muconate lactonizing enzyme family protein [Neoroseomonas nitratireducens]
MKITRVTTHHHRTGFTFGASTQGAGGNLHLRAMDTLLVRVETDAGIHGWGEGFGFTVAETTKDAVDRLIGPACIGQDAGDIAGLTRMLARRFHNFGRNGPVTFGISAIDIALWDIRAKAAGKPLHALLGPAARPAVPAYASLLRYGRPDDVARNVERALALGYRHIKLHEVDLACIRAAHAAAPDVPLMLDINCAWDTEGEAIEFCESVATLGAAWVEEPVWPPEDIPAIARIRAASPVPIAAGECNGTVEDFCRMFELRAVDVAQPSVTKIGGLSAMLEIAELAREAGVRMVPHCPYFGPGLLATLHLLAALEEAEPIEIYFADLDRAPYGAALLPRGGAIALPQAPGLGWEPEPG